MIGKSGSAAAEVNSIIGAESIIEFHSAAFQVYKRSLKTGM